ncbi:hypothetical protein [Halalkalicoccus salilacus]|uniref:hypothetical protein n=1 Tax=Halalkalicoccus salilacus TaxID=3117459 RepID=UPI00300F18EC
MRRKRAEQVLTIMGFGSILLAVTVAWHTPATSYELSILQETPFITWGALFLSLLLGIGLSFYGQHFRRFGIFLSGLTLLSWISMPLIRGYYLYAPDALVHLGHVKSILETGQTDSIFYPATHILASTLSMIGAVESRIALYIMTPIFAILYFIFTPLFITRVSTADHRAGYGVALVLTLMLLPVNWMGVHLHPHPASYGIFFIPALLFIVFQYQRTPELENRVLLLTSIPFLVLIHPLVAVFALGVFIAFEAVSLTVSAWRGKLSMSASLAFPVAFLSILVMYYVLRFEYFQSTFIGVITALFASTPESATAAETTGLTQLGLNPLEIALRYIGVSLVIGIIAAIAGLASLRKVLNRRDTIADRWILFACLSMIPLFGMAAVFFVSGFSLHFRVLGLGMVLCTIAAGIYLTDRSYIPSNPSKLVSYAATAGLTILLALSLLTALPSPFIMQSMGHVSESMASGGEVTATYADSNHDVETIRTHWSRLMYGTMLRDVPNSQRLPPDHFNERNLPAAYSGKVYLFTTQEDREVDGDLYQGLRFNKGDFEYLEEDPSIDHVVSTGDSDVYLVSGQNSTR